jgi:hypothetical protein
MKYLVIVFLALGCVSAAQADIWKWVDANGDVHFVSSANPIYMWVDENGDVHYSDTPGHETARTVDLVWVSGGSLEEPEQQQAESQDDGWAFEGETEEQRAERERAEAYYCKRASEVYESYVNAPRLYKTNDDGEREYLSDEEMAQMIADTRNKKDEICQ